MTTDEPGKLNFSINGLIINTTNIPEVTQRFVCRYENNVECQEFEQFLFVLTIPNKVLKVTRNFNLLVHLNSNSRPRLFLAVALRLSCLQSSQMMSILSQVSSSFSTYLLNTNSLYSAKVETLLHDKK